MDAEKTYFGMTLPKPDLFSYNTALNACARAGQWRWSLALFERLREVGLVASERPDRDIGRPMTGLSRHTSNAWKTWRVMSHNQGALLVAWSR